VNVEGEENVNAGQQIAILNAGTDMEISLGLPESIIYRVQSGMKVSINFPVLGETTFQGKVSEVSPSVDANTAIYPVRIVVTTPSKEIRAGMAANVSFNFSPESDQPRKLVVPAISVGEDGNGRFVFLLKEEEGMLKAHKKYVEIGSLSTEGFTIEQGLSFGDKIATAGLQTMLDGQEVQLQPM
jgi:RND family efflux transporter MFP subunit